MQKLHIRCQVDHFTELQVLQAEDLSLVFYQAGSVHLSDADEARLLALLLERAGGVHNLCLEALMAEEDEEDEEWENSATPCPGCGTICSAGFEFCNRCSDERSDPEGCLCEWCGPDPNWPPDQLDEDFGVWR